MDFSFRLSLGDPYKSPLQKIRVLSEHWVGRQVYCPSCGLPEIVQYSNNSPVADFFCAGCKEDFELKSQAKLFGAKVVDGAYGTMMRRLSASNNPNLFLLHYDPAALAVTSLLVIPKHFFVPEMIERRSPLSPLARRAGWIGCNILLHGIPHAGKIYLVRDRIAEPKDVVLAKWRKVLFLRDEKDQQAKGWLLSVIKCIEKIKKRTFTLDELYQFEDELKLSYPTNRHIKEKIRQKLQILRDKGYLEFLGGGLYRLGAKS
jgi:type II restriction enzyme